MNPIRSVLQSIATYLHDIDDRSRRQMSREEEERADVAEERSSSRLELELETALFVGSLPAWVRHPDRFRDAEAAASSLDPAEIMQPEDAIPGADWAAAADLHIEPSGSHWPALLHRGDVDAMEWMLTRVSRGRKRKSLVRGTRLRLVGQATTNRARGDEDVILTIDEAPPGDRGLLFEVADGPSAGRVIRTSALSRSPSTPALIAAAMIAPAGHRIVDWPSAADEFLARLERRAAVAERSAREVADEERWAWRHDLIGRPVVDPVRVRRKPSDEDARRK